MSEPSEPVTIAYFSDLLCIWAYLSQLRVDELRRHFGRRIRVEPHFIPVFGNAKGKIADRWDALGGVEAYAAHVREIAGQFEEIEVHPQIWAGCMPASSLAGHLFVKAAALVAETPVVEALTWRLRLAFFRDLQDIGRLDVLFEIADGLDLPREAIRRGIDDGTALAALAADHELVQRHQIQGSPTFLINDGRQKLYGNVGYGVIEANIQELLRSPVAGAASWC
jgi:predicted DsbA family dithiol-disulfide isomerase